jgi:hypothetical protein
MIKNGASPLLYWSLIGGLAGMLWFMMIGAWWAQDNYMWWKCAASGAALGPLIGIVLFAQQKRFPKGFLRLKGTVLTLLGTGAGGVLGWATGWLIFSMQPRDQKPGSEIPYVMSSQLIGAGILGFFACLLWVVRAKSVESPRSDGGRRTF